MLDRFAFRKKAVKKGEHSAVCSECSRGGYTEMTLRMHLQDMHNYLPCKACRKIYPGEAGLKEHRCPLQNLTCDKCPKKFGSLDGWKLHMRTVHGQYRRRVKIPKEKVVGADSKTVVVGSTPTKGSSDIEVSPTSSPDLKSTSLGMKLMPSI